MTISKQITLLIICILTIYVNAQESVLTTYNSKLEVKLPSIEKYDVPYLQSKIFIEQGDHTYNFDNEVYNKYIHIYGIKRIIVNNYREEFIDKNTLVVNNYVETGSGVRWYNTLNHYGVTNEGVIINNYGKINVNRNTVVNNYNYIRSNEQNITTNYKFIGENKGMIYNNTCIITSNQKLINHNDGNVTHNEMLILNNTGNIGNSEFSGMSGLTLTCLIIIMQYIDLTFRITTSNLGIMCLIFWFINIYYKIKFIKRK